MLFNDKYDEYKLAVLDVVSDNNMESINILIDDKGVFFSKNKKVVELNCPQIWYDPGPVYYPVANIYIGSISGNMDIDFLKIRYKDGRLDTTIHYTGKLTIRNNRYLLLNPKVEKFYYSNEYKDILKKYLLSNDDSIYNGITEENTNIFKKCKIRNRKKEILTPKGREGSEIINLFI